MATELMTDAMISVPIPQALFSELETLASELDLSTQDLIQIAMDAYLEQRDALRAEHARIKAAYADYPDETERLWQEAMLADMRQRLVEDEENPW